MVCRCRFTSTAWRQADQWWLSAARREFSAASTWETLLLTSWCAETKTGGNNHSNRNNNSRNWLLHTRINPTLETTHVRKVQFINAQFYLLSFLKCLFFFVELVWGMMRCSSPKLPPTGPDRARWWLRSQYTWPCGRWLMDSLKSMFSFLYLCAPAKRGRRWHKTGSKNRTPLSYTYTHTLSFSFSTKPIW